MKLLENRTSWIIVEVTFANCDLFYLQIAYDRIRRQGSSIILHDGEIRNFGKMVAVSTSMTATLTMIHKNLTKLYRILKKSKTKSETNLPILIDYFLKLSLDYRNLATDKCLSHS